MFIKEYGTSVQIHGACEQMAPLTWITLHVPANDLHNTVR